MSTRRALGSQSLTVGAGLGLLVLVAIYLPLNASGQTGEQSPSIVYVSTAGGGISEINTTNESVIATAPFPDNANGVAITPDGRRMYAADRDVPKVIVFDTTTNVPLAQIPIGNGPLSVAITPDGKHVYATNQIDGTVSVIATATNQVVDTIATGVEPIWVTFNANGTRAYVSNQVSGSLSVVATASNSVIATIPGFCNPFHSAFAHGGRLLFVSSQCDSTVKVVDTVTNLVINSIPVGPLPRGIAFSPDGRRAYVANFAGNAVDVLDVDSQTNLGIPITVGNSPWGLAMAPNGKAYVANFGDGTVSVIDTSTNSVVATLPTRSNPEDVTLSRRARPLILSYQFQAIAPPGSPFSWVRGMNNKGDAVGDYADSNWVLHGFLRTHTGMFSTIDPQGGVGCQLCTSAFSISDAGVIVGAYRDSNNVLHGFRRSPAGVYTTVDFPGAQDSQLTGVNNLGHNSGVYDLGNLGSTHCPGPQCQAISFVLRAGVFDTFEDPDAAPQTTFAFSINDFDQTCGSFTDLTGNTHGFVRDPHDGSFKTIQFPLADNYSSVNQINNRGTMAGEYNLRLGHGLLTDGSNFFSFDYPNSDFSGLRAVNNRGQVGGYFVSSGKFTAYIATPREE
jgi:YVTN family beta-propeller protein